METKDRINAIETQNLSSNNIEESTEKHRRNSIHRSWNRRSGLGCNIQYLSNGNWCDYEVGTSPSFNWSRYGYRIKPESDDLPALPEYAEVVRRQSVELKYNGLEGKSSNLEYRMLDDAGDWLPCSNSCFMWSMINYRIKP